MFPKTKCQKCEYEWNNRVEKPLKCPRCGHAIGRPILREEIAKEA